ncbi:MAG: NAD(+)/NADH kinase, partial [Syntrophobacteraceae bacterium]|nr:NAD(+)/NADH kinase [Syntrophobacteraceae bacterium]
RCIITLGGDGTNRVVAKGARKVPILPISTGTNNVFSFMVEATIAGMAAGLLATDRTPLEECVFHSTRLDIKLDGEVVDLALVDVAVCGDLFVGSKAVWDMARVSQIFLNRADPGSIGLSAIGGCLHPLGADEPGCLCLRIGGGEGCVVKAPVAPGVIDEVVVSEQKVMNVDEEVEIATVPSVLALDGEREVEVHRGQNARIRLEKDGPLVVDVSRTMNSAMKRGVLVSTPKGTWRRDG